MNQTKKTKGYTAIPLSPSRQMLIAAVDGNKKNAIHCITEIDITKPREFLREHQNKTGLKISFTAYIVRCFAKALQEYPQLNSFIKRRKLILLDDINISVMIERQISDESIPEPLAIKKAQEKTLKQIHDEIREAQKVSDDQLGSLTHTRWIKYIPYFLMRRFIKVAERNISMAKRYGKVAVTAVGMFTKSATWFIPHGTATVLLTVGGINKKMIQEENGIVAKEYLSITASFDHEIVDGAPAARFVTLFTEILEQGSFLEAETKD